MKYGPKIINDLKPHICRLSANFRFSGRNSQSQQKLILQYIFAKKPCSFYEPQLTQHWAIAEKIKKGWDTFLSLRPGTFRVFILSMEISDKTKLHSPPETPQNCVTPFGNFKG